MKKAEIIEALNTGYGLSLEDTKDLTYENLKKLHAHVEKGVRVDELEALVAEKEETIVGLQSTLESLSKELKSTEDKNESIAKSLGADAVFSFERQKYQLLKKFRTGKFIVDIKFLQENPEKGAALAKRFPNLIKTL